MVRFFSVLLLALFAPLTVSYAAEKSEKSKSKRPKIAVITTGGTIAQKIDPATGSAVPSVSGKDLVKAVPEIVQYADIDVFQFSNIDSSQMTPEIWLRLSREVDKYLLSDKYDGAIVTHGTDTMAQGAFFLQLTLKTKKPVVFVGSMRNASEISPDGPMNLKNAVIQLASGQGNDWGVTVSLDQYILSARYARKINTTNIRAFGGGIGGNLGYIAEGKVLKYNENTYRHKLPLPDKLPDVALLRSFAGDDGRYIRHAVDTGAKGIVIEALGSGNINEKAYEQVRYAVSKGVAVVITSCVSEGGCYPAYGVKGGGQSLEKAGALLAGDIRGDKARLLLMLVLANSSTDWLKHSGLFR